MPKAFCSSLFGYLIFCLVLVEMTLFVGYPEQQAAPWDVFVMLGGAYKMVHGYIPSVDFYSPLGPVTYVVIEVGLKVTSMSIQSIPIGLVISSVPLALLSWFLCHRRVPPVYCFAYSACIVLNWLCPFPYRFLFWTPSYAGLYNREAGSFLMLVMVMLLEQERKDRKGLRLENFLTGSLFALLFFTKIPYFLAALVLLPVSLVREPYIFLRMGWLSLGGVVFSLAITLSLHLNPWLMLQDLHLAAMARSSEVIRWNLENMGTDVVPILVFLFCPALLECLLLLEKGKLRLSTIRFLTLAEFPFVSTSAVLVVMGNAPDGIPLGMPALQFYALILIRRLYYNLKQIHLSVKETFLKNLAAAISLVLFAEGFFWGIAGMIYAFLYALSGQTHGLFIPSRLPDSNRYEYMQFSNGPYHDTVTDGLAMLARHPDLDKCSIGSFDFSDSFEFILKRPPTPGMPVGWQYGRMQSEKSYPAPERIFRGCDLLMVPPWEPLLPQLYGPYMREHYVLIDEAQYWKLYLRKELVRADSAGRP